MKPFRSQLQIVLTLREQAEQKALEAYARTLETRERQWRQLRQIDDQITGLKSHWHESLAQSCQAHILLGLENFSQELVIRRREKLKAWEVAEASVQKALQQMLLARRQREVIEKLIENQRVLHALEVVKEEQKTIDEMGQRRSLPTISMTRTSTPFGVPPLGGDSLRNPGTPNPLGVPPFMPSEAPSGCFDGAKEGGGDSVRSPTSPTPITHNH